MGWDIHTIGRHHLELRDAETVARQLSERLDININYGYRNYYTFSEDNHTVQRNDDSKWISLGCIIRRPEKDLYHLEDTDFRRKEILSICKAKGIQPVTEDNSGFSLEEDDLLFLLETWEEEPNGLIYNLEIFQETFLVSLCDDPGRWSGFYHFFDDSKYTCYELKHLYEYRRRLKRVADALKCEYVYLYSDQGPSARIDNELSNTWCKVETYIKSLKWIDDDKNVAKRNCAYNMEAGSASARSLFRLIDIPSFLSAEQPVRSAYYNDIFRDDFSDLA